MSKRKQKMHKAVPNSMGQFPGTRCGTDGPFNFNDNAVTCRVCWFHILADVAPWARGFLDGLRGKPGARERKPVTIPGATPEPVNGKVKGLGDGFARAFADKGVSEKAVRELLAMCAPDYTSIQEVMERGRPAADAIGVQPGQVAEDAGNAGQVSDEAFWGY